MFEKKKMLLKNLVNGVVMYNKKNKYFKENALSGKEIRNKSYRDEKVEVEAKKRNKNVSKQKKNKPKKNN